MITALPFINKLLAVGAIIAIALSLVLIIEKIFKLKLLSKFFAQNILWVGFVISLGSILTSLFYSNIVGFEPCTLCWIQRVFMYPQALIFGLALFKKSRAVLPWVLALSIMGLIVAIYHVYIDFGGSELFNCAAIGAVSCTKRYVFEFGFVTIPVMSGAMFTLMVASILAARSEDK